MRRGKKERNKKEKKGRRMDGRVSKEQEKEE